MNFQTNISTLLIHIQVKLLSEMTKLIDYFAAQLYPVCLRYVLYMFLVTFKTEGEGNIRPIVRDMAEGDDV